MKTTGATLTVRKSRPGTGLGLFALRSIKAGDCIVEYKGVHIPTKHADTLKTRYLFEINDAWTIDGSKKDNLARYINHSCTPNCEAELQNERVYIFATRDIAHGEELTIDYGDEYFDEFIRPTGCKCESCALRISVQPSIRDLRDLGRELASRRL